MRPRPDRDHKILALDLATVLGWGIGQPSGEPRWGHLRLRGESPAAASMELAKWLKPLLREERPRLVAVETPPSPMWKGRQTNAATNRKLNALAVKAEECCLELGIECVHVDAAQWKKLLCGTARVSKDQRPYPPIEALAQRGWQVDDHNAADALGIWLFAVTWRAPKLAMRFDPLARKLAGSGRCYVSKGWCTTHGDACKGSRR